MRVFLNVLAFSCFMIGSIALASPQSFNYQGRILRANGTPLEYNDVKFLMQVTDPAGTCVIFQEQISGYNMVNSGGIFDLPLGNNARQYIANGMTDFLRVFENSAALECATCTPNGGGGYNCVGAGTFYNPAPGDIRKLRVSFDEGTGWKAITPDNVIRSVPYSALAFSAERVGNVQASDILTRALAPTCVAANSFLQWNGTDFDCVAVSMSNIDAGQITTGTITNNVLNTNTSSGTGSFQNLRIYDGSSQYLTQNYPTGGASYTIQWPANQGAASSVLMNDGSGVLSWSALPSAPVSSVAGKTGVVSLVSADIPDLAVTCSAQETLTWSTVTDTFACQAIASLSPTAINFTGTANAVVKLSGAGALQESSIRDNGSVVTTSRAIASLASSGTSANIDLSTSNTHVITSVGGSVLTLSNPTHGAMYSIVIEDGTSRTYTFSGCTNTFFKPGNGATEAGTRSIYGLMTVDKGSSNWDCYVTWATGYQ